MKVLFANHALAHRTGSELGTIELARAVAARGHDVAIFAMMTGPLASAVRREGDVRVFSRREIAELRAFAPDIVHSHHLTAAHYLREMLPAAVRVHEMLGVLPALELPPSTSDGFDLAIALSEEIEAVVRATPFGRDVPVRLMRNWFDDSETEDIPRRPMPKVPRLLVVSNYVAPRLRGSLLELQSRGEITVAFIGGLRERPVTPRMLANADIVVALGRTVLQAAACGIPCIVADRDCSDGLLTAGNVTALRRANFSGRVSRIDASPAHLRAEIAAARLLDTRPLQQIIRAEYGLRARADALLVTYEALLDDHTAARAFHPAEGQVFADLCAQLERSQRRFDLLTGLPVLRQATWVVQRLRRHLRDSGLMH